MVIALPIGGGTFPFVPESERWAINSEQCRAATSGKFNRTDDREAAPESPATEAPRKLTEVSMLKRVAIAIVLPSLQQFFALADLVQVSDILQDLDRALANRDRPKMTTAGMLAHGFNSNNAVIAVFVAVPALLSLWLVDKAGRRTLLLFGAFIMSACQPTVAFMMENECEGTIFQRNCGKNTNSWFNLPSILAVAAYGLT
ncbi:hypothetical protein Gpo141_00009742 [Globisporangium polare]